MILSIDNQLFPCIDYIKKLDEYRYVEIFKYDWFRKRSFVNRYVIAGANGLTNLTIPIQGGREQKSLISEVRIDNSANWQTKHWRSITSAYSKAPFFDYYSAEVKSLIYSSETSLFNLNYLILNKVCKWLNLNTVITLTAENKVVPEELDYRNKILPGNFQNNKENWQPKYAQVFEDRLGFQPNLSILDLLFCEGPNAIELVRKSIRINKKS